MVFREKICYDAVKSTLAWHIHNLPTRYVPIPNKIYAMQIRKALFSPVECLSLFLGASRGVPFLFAPCGSLLSDLPYGSVTRNHSHLP